MDSDWATTPAVPSDVARLAAVLGEAMADDPLWSWAIPQVREARRRRLTVLYTGFLRASLGRGDTVLTTQDRSAVGIFRAPGRRGDTWRDMLRMAPRSIAALRVGLGKLIRYDNACSDRAPSRPHWYLYVLGTDPAIQGTGAGSALVAALVRRAEAAAVPIALETETEGNVAWYAGRGFEVTDTFEIASGVRVWTMLRPSQI
jgi:ribosomal protein S18 acetylase RimI-like enzyme